MATAAKRPDMSAAEWEARQQLAACYRIFDHMGWSELIYNHITLRVPGEDGAFLINPFGLGYDEVTASNLVKIDIDGHVRPMKGADTQVHAARRDLPTIIIGHADSRRGIGKQAGAETRHGRLRR